MSERPLILVDPLPRTLAMICAPDVRARLEALGRLEVSDDAPMDPARVDALLPDAVALVGQTDLPAGRHRARREAAGRDQRRGQLPAQRRLRRVPCARHPRAVREPGVRGRRRRERARDGHRPRARDRRGRPRDARRAGGVRARLERRRLPADGRARGDRRLRRPRPGAAAAARALPLPGARVRPLAARGGGAPRGRRARAARRRARRLARRLRPRRRDERQRRLPRRARAAADPRGRCARAHQPRGRRRLRCARARRGRGPAAGGGRRLPGGAARARPPAPRARRRAPLAAPRGRDARGLPRARRGWRSATSSSSCAACRPRSAAGRSPRPSAGCARAPSPARKRRESEVRGIWRRRARLPAPGKPGRTTSTSRLAVHRQSSTGIRQPHTNFRLTTLAHICGPSRVAGACDSTTMPRRATATRPGCSSPCSRSPTSGWRSTSSPATR